MLVDILSVTFVDRIGYRASVIIAHLCAVMGFVFLTVLPDKKNQIGKRNNCPNTSHNFPVLYVKQVKKSCRYNHHCHMPPIVNNFVPLLFLTFHSSYGIPMTQITLLITFNFGLQLLVDSSLARGNKFITRMHLSIDREKRRKFSALPSFSVFFYPFHGKIYQGNRRFYHG